jgi:hypothetical protein
METNQVNNHIEFMVFDAARAGQEWERRFFLMIELCSPRRGGIGFLASKTGITERRWKNVLMFKQKPALDMALALAWLRPELARWFWTGSTEGPNTRPSQNEIDLINEARLVRVRRSPNPDLPEWLRQELDEQNQTGKPTLEQQPERILDWSQTGQETSQTAKVETDILQPDQPNPNW